MTRKQVNDLDLSDLQKSCVWEFALDEEDHEGQDEATVRPFMHEGELDPTSGMFVVKAAFQLADGSKMTGYLSPPLKKSSNLSILQPVIITQQGQVLFWWGAIIPKPSMISQSYARLGKATPAEVFPIKFAADVACTCGPITGEIPGFLVVADIQTMKVRVIE